MFEIETLIKGTLTDPNNVCYVFNIMLCVPNERSSIVVKRFAVPDAKVLDVLTMRNIISNSKTIRYV